MRPLSVVCHSLAAVLSGAVLACRPAAPGTPAPTPAPGPAAPAPVAVGAPATPGATPGADAPRVALPSSTPLRLTPVLASLAEHRVVPHPSEVTPAAGAPFALDTGTRIVAPAGDTAARRVAAMLGTLLRPAVGAALPVVATDGPAPRRAIVLRIGAVPGGMPNGSSGGPTTGATGAADDAPFGDEAYLLDVSADSVRLVARTAAGLFRGTQTLRQLLPAGIEADQSALRLASAWTVPAGRIVDRPRFAWRGAMLDVARHFFTVDEVEQFIDLLALYKLNTLHLHLSDDQGWRIQIDAWPRLATVGGSSEVGGRGGGFYTKADYARLVQYAQARFVTVVPEIDLPGHTNAAIAAYPELGCSRPTPGLAGGTQPPGIYTGIRVGWSTVCPDSAVTWRFVDDVVRELAAMTPGRYLHLGGDEVAALTPDQYARFVARAQETVERHGKRMIGWEEIVKAPLRPGTVVQPWIVDTAHLSRRQGARLVLSPASRSYLDMKYAPDTELGLRWAGLVELRAAYDWDPATLFRGVGERDVLGVEAPLWTETARNLTAALYLVVPRLPAIAEVGWTPQTRRTWDGFRTRIAAHAPRWRLLGVNFHPSPQVDWEPQPPPRLVP